MLIRQAGTLWGHSALFSGADNGKETGAGLIRTGKAAWTDGHGWRSLYRYKPGSLTGLGVRAGRCSCHPVKPKHVLRNKQVAL